MTVAKFLALTPELHAYMVEHSSFRGGVAEEVESAAEGMGDLALMQISGDQAALISLLVGAVGARRALEVGTFLGYGAIAIARGLPEDGELVICELDDAYAGRAREHLAMAGLADRAEFLLGPALDSLGALPVDPPFDFAFVDADKESYPDYYEQCLRLLRPGGLMMLDNVLLDGRVLDPPDGDKAAEVMRELNDRIVADHRVEVAMLAVADGITLARKL
jgi:caffeoyl-CoA O-methyltransferase